jgi:hypothetical protein
MIPANETWLANLGWKNGSLDQQNASGTLPWNEWSPAHNATQPVNLTILANNIAAIQFLVTDPNRFDVQNFPAKFALARTLLSDNYYSQAVTCVYPISGTYDFLTRILFYLLLFFALLYRRHTWVAVAALGTAMTYSATTAVHALALLTHFGWNDGIRNVYTSKEHGDPDIWGTYPVLLATVVMFAPILNWSTNVRRDKAQIIMVLWGMLSFAALVPVMVYISSSADQKMLHPWNPNDMGAVMLWPRSAAEANTICKPPINVTLETYTTCQCTDFCSLLSPAAPMRAGTVMVPWLQSQLVTDLANVKAFAGFIWWSQVLAAMIVCYGGLGLIHSYFSLREMRDLILRLLSTRPEECKDLWKLSRNKNSVPKVVDYTTMDAGTRFFRVQSIFAKTLATLYYVLGMLIAFICPVVVLAVIVNVELFMAQFSYSERSDAVGAWSTWVGAAFVLIFAIILRYQDAWEHFSLRSGESIVKMLGFDGLEDTDSRRTAGQPAITSQSANTNTGSNILLHVLNCSIGGASVTVKLVFLEFGDWMKASLSHGQICSCEGCVFYRNLIRKASTVTPHAERCSCDECEMFKVEVDKASKSHKNPCGCRLCVFKRTQAHWRRQQTAKRVCNHFNNYTAIDEASIASKSIEEQGYQTLGNRVLKNFDKRILKMLESVDALPMTLPSTSLLKRQSTNASNKTQAGDMHPVMRFDVPEI